MKSKSTPRCRVCLEKSEETSRLISPCACRGSSRYIHEHCLHRWQLTSFEGNRPAKAVCCTVCCHAYRPGPPLWWRLYYKWKSSSTFCSTLWVHFIIVPAKVLTHVVLITMMLLSPWKSIQLFGGLQLSWVGGFPPQVALTSYSDDENGSLRDGVLLVATVNVPETSCFYRAVVLVLKHARGQGTTGIIINADTADSICMPPPDDSPTAAREVMRPVQLQVGFGGPLERHQLTILHTRSEWADGSDVLPLEPTYDDAATADGLASGGQAGSFIYVAEEDTARAIEEAAFPSVFSQFHSGFPSVSALHQIQLVAQGVHSPARTAAAAVDSAGPRRSNSTPFARLSNAAAVAPLHASLRVIRGHAYWGAGQLSGEIRDGYWSVQPTDSDAIFCADRQQLWSTLAAIGD